MIKAVVLDVDGVIVGSQEGFNFPYPHKEVIWCLGDIRKRGIFVCLLTGKTSFAIKKIILDAHLDNLHVAYGGAVGFNPFMGGSGFEYSLDKKNVLRLVKFYFDYGIYMEIYESDDYFVLEEQIDQTITPIRTKILQKEPRVIARIEEIGVKSLVKINLLACNPVQKELIDRSFADEFGEDMLLSMSSNPNTKNWHYGIVTARGVSKKQGVEELSKNLGVRLDDILGVGDTMHDWQFIEMCGYGGTLSDGDETLKKLVLQKGDRGFVGGVVNQNGVLDVLAHFGLI